ncbi:MAG: hypothetical protein OXG47_05770 [bacterium]|nr:hypothetical protein [bacterium]MCY3925209.1 hypothetical protein [bacterium]
MSSETEGITRDDLEAKLREAADALNAASAPARRTAWRASVLSAALLVVASYFLGRRRGRLSRTFVELRRY